MISLDKLPKLNKKKKRTGRGNSSGSGNYSGRGMKGQNSRAGGGTRRGFEGGQNPLTRRIPKYRGNPPRYKPYFVINIADLENFKKGEIVSPETLVASGVVDNLHKYRGIKILGLGKSKKTDYKFKDCVIDGTGSAKK